ncbi:hypothetical protein [Lentzea sp. HUAS12]|uniref:hypothetical protein n=1 Tax=Lentzea sp. HUAS12 TaxID=2951806 RepID=UPI00209EA4AB|nr:hypothetical protein [Lentzea sp. HUAS12]USX56351.1 hypothetical protein ND450_20290 [Lentzea sp. HUAS12]
MFDELDTFDMAALEIMPISNDSVEAALAAGHGATEIGLSTSFCSVGCSFAGPVA